MRHCSKPLGAARRGYAVDRPAASAAAVALRKNVQGWLAHWAYISLRLSGWGWSQ